MTTIAVYSKPEDSIPKCYACESTKKWLNKYGFEYTVHDITTPENIEYAKSLGHQQAPMVLVTEDDGTEKHWSGFNPLELTKLAA